MKDLKVGDIWNDVEEGWCDVYEDIKVIGFKDDDVIVEIDGDKHEIPRCGFDDFELSFRDGKKIKFIPCMDIRNKYIGVVNENECDNWVVGDFFPLLHSFSDFHQRYQTVDFSQCVENAMKEEGEKKAQAIMSEVIDYGYIKCKRDW